MKNMNMGVGVGSMGHIGMPGMSGMPGMGNMGAMMGSHMMGGMGWDQNMKNWPH